MSGDNKDGDFKAMKSDEMFAELEDGNEVTHAWTSEQGSMRFGIFHLLKATKKRKEKQVGKLTRT